MELTEPQERQLFTFYFYGMSPTKISKIMRIPPTIVQQYWKKFYLEKMANDLEQTEQKIVTYDEELERIKQHYNLNAASPIPKVDLQVGK